MLKSVRYLVPGLVLFLASAVSMLAQNHPMPGHKSEAPVLCIGCNPNTNASGQLNDGLPTYPYSGALIAHVGRYVDSNNTQSYQMWENSYRTARARIIRTSFDQRGSAPPRVYVQIGNGIGVYSLDTFFSSRLPGGMVNIGSIFRSAGSREKILKWDAFVYPEDKNSGWQIEGGDFQDPMSKVMPIDFDDRGNLYVATERFGWAIVQDDGRTAGTHLPKTMQLVNQINPEFTKTMVNPSGVSAEAIVSVKVGTKYYVVTADRISKMAVFDVTTPTTPKQYGASFSSRKYAMRAVARDDETQRVAYIDNNRKLRIVDYAAIITGGEPVAEYTGEDSDFGEVVHIDEQGIVWAVEKTGKVWKLTPAGSGYTKSTYTPLGSFEPIMIHAAAGYLAVGGVDKTLSTYDVRLLRVESNGLAPVDVDSFFRKYYHQAPVNYAQPGSYTALAAQSPDVEIIKQGGKIYLMYSGFGLGDVFEIQGGNSIVIAARSGFGTTNPNAKPTQSGPFVGDTVTFVANSSSSSTAYDVNWNFGNPESGANNTGRSRTGEDEAHQFTGLTTAAQITAVKQVKAQTVQDPNIGSQHNVTLKVPTPRVGVGTPTVAIAANTSTLEVVAGDTFKDSSDGSVEGHVGVWTLDGTVSTLKPNDVLPVGDIGAHTLQFRGSYGAYDANLVVASPYNTPTLTLGYTVRPFLVSINTPTTDGTNVTFTATARVAPSPVFTATSWNAVWTINGVPQTAAGSVSTNSVATPPNIPALTLPKTAFTDGSVIGLQVVVDPSGLSDPAKVYPQYSTSSTLSTPDPQIQVDGCANANSPCTFTATSASGKSVADWGLSWTLTQNGVAKGSGTGANFSPTISAAGTYTVSLKATKTIFEATATKDFTAGASLCGPLPQAVTLTISKVGCTTSCAPGTDIEFAPTYQGYAKQACDSYSWDLGDGNTKTGEVVHHSYASAGQYTVRLTVSNSSGATLQKSTTVTVTSGSQPPPPPPTSGCTVPTNITVTAACSNSPCRTTDSVTFTARRGTASLQTCDNVAWTFSDNTTSSLKSVTKSFSNPGTYTATAKVSNTNGTAADASTSITISAANNGNCSVAPSLGNFSISYSGATSGCTLTNGKPCNGGETISFEAFNYYYVLASCDNFEWDFGDGSPKTSERTPTHTFAGGQTYSVKLRVYNGAGQYIYSRSVQVAGTTPTKPLPVITASSFPTTGQKGKAVTFSASSNLDTTTGWLWTVLEGNATVATDPSHAGTVAKTSSMTYTFTKTGTFTVKVAARNSEDLATAPSASAQSNIVITEAPAIPEFKYLLPVTAYTAGQGGSAWRTDVQIYNPDPQVSEAKPLVMDATFKGHTYPLQMIKATHIYENFLGMLLSLQKEDSGPVIITTKSAMTPPQIWTRTYTQTENGTYGQFIPAIRLDNIGSGGAATDNKYYMSGLRHDSRYRTNVGFLNPNAAPITATVTVYDEDHYVLGTFPLSLNPFDLKQFTLQQYAATLAQGAFSIPTDAPFSVMIEVPTGQWLVSYASYIDGLSNDPVYIQAVPRSDVASADYKTSIVPGVGHIGGWRSDLTIFNPDASGVQFDLEYFNAAGEKKGEALSVKVDGGKFLQYTDLLKQGILGNVDDGVGTLKLTVKTPSLDYYPMTFARTYFDNTADGTYGQGISGFAAVRANVKANKPAIIAGVRNNSLYYTNIGLVNVSSAPVTATVTLLDPTTGAAVLAVPYTVNPNQSIVGVFNQNNWNNIESGTFRIEANGDVWAFASIIDNRTKDPEYVPATPAQ
jgi:PKD repeat protein